ncbi:MAG TPA: hypothetical protein VJT49_25025 [Amycolatopsis sp.]|uniref:hypothetical protein n=1 Tax=Amycolatopsis sp. TaxID=37632 RepID=UPI002B491824|nr:hypothetical protein [Amycolatopsis sp.]HKS48313.1 hypothetical protein [Amycolatopsis sp.]
MGTPEALEILARDWDGVRSLLGEADLRRVSEMVGELADEAVPDAMLKRSNDLARFLARRLPREHPVRRALADTGTRLASSRDPRELSRWSANRESLRLAVLDDGVPSAEEVARRASEWLLATESLSEPEVRDRGWDPGDPGLIRLDRDDGGRQWPAFQFTAAIVPAINQILDAAGDPWGVADWWLGEHARLGDAPVRLIGQVADQVLVDAAMAERPAAEED